MDEKNLENKIEEEKKELKEKRERTKKLDESNDAEYTENKIKKKEEEVVRVRVEKGYKDKVIERVTYRNGVVKNRLKGILINGIVKYGQRPSQKKVK